jgi:acyl-coenzyme A thioesterase PaaI-like protein
VSHSYFQRIHGDDLVGGYRATDATVGPWNPGLQHGGPPNALAVTLADRVVRAATGRDDLVPLRLSAEFLGPVPVAEITATTAVVRPGRSAVLAEVRLAAGGRDCLHVRVWFVRRADTAAVAPALAPPPPVPDANTPGEWTFGYAASLDWRYVSGSNVDAGPAAAWVRSRVPLLDDGSATPGLARVVLVADSASGVAAELSWSQWSFVNVDLDVHLARPFTGEWVLLDAATQLGPDGSALARSVISDVDGVAGAGLQTLVVSRLP